MEVCVDNLESVAAAVAGGAARIELCSALSEGGLTPTLGLAAAARRLASSVPVFAMVRPRRGHFVYSEAEVDMMAADAASLAASGFVDGVVFGCLNNDGTVDEAACKKRTAMETVVGLGFSRVLTSGQAATADAGRALIADLVRDFGGCGVSVMPGAGLAADNLERVLRDTGAREFHASARARKQPSPVPSPKCSMGSADDGEAVAVTSEDAVRAMVAIYNEVYSGKK